MANVVIYTTPVCPYCVRSKKLLENKGVKYEEIDASNHDVRQDLLQKSGGQRTVPQIFINDQHIGGFDALYDLDIKGELDKLLEED